jgi:phosphoglycerate kinase
VSKKDIRDAIVDGKRVLVRVDFNVPLDVNTGAILDDSRIKATIPTIEYLISHNAKLILCSHLGRPDGHIVETLRMAPVALKLSQLMGLPIFTSSECVGESVKKQVATLKGGQILLLENVRFHPEEEANDPVFSRKLADLADIYVNDAFGTAHRAHASTVGVAAFLPAYSGLLMKKEIETLGQLLSKPKRPFAALLGGAKVSDKIGLIKNIIDKVELVLIGGGMAATFLKVKGYEVGRSKVESDKLELAAQLMKTIEENGVSIILPPDVMVAEEIAESANSIIVPVSNISSNQYIVDVGNQTIELFTNHLRKCQTIFWNGPMGIYEIPKFSNGTKAMVQLLATVKATTIVGGGSTAEIVVEMNLMDKITHVSTGGGASLEFLEGKVLPGVSVLMDK